MAKVPFKVEGVADVNRALAALTPPTQRNALMRTLRRNIKPLADAVIARAPYRFGDLKENLRIGTRLTKRQASMREDKKATAELHFGTADPAGMMEEFGLAGNDVNPFFRPEWEGQKRSILSNIGRDMGEEIVKAGERAARKRARGK